MPSYSGRRFSLDVGEDGFLLSNGSGVDYLQSTIQIPQSKSSLNGSLLSHSSSQLPVRRRASTSSALLFSPSNLGDDPFFGDLSYDGDPFETSQGTYLNSPSISDPLFGHLHGRSSLSIDPADPLASTNSLGMESSLHGASSLRSSHFPLNASFVPFDQNYSLGQNLDFPAEPLDDSKPLFRPGRSFSEIDMSTLPDSIDLTPGSLLAEGPSSLRSIRNGSYNTGVTCWNDERC